MMTGYLLLLWFWFIKNIIVSNLYTTDRPLMPTFQLECPLFFLFEERILHQVHSARPVGLVTSYYYKA